MCVQPETCGRLPSQGSQLYKSPLKCVIERREFQCHEPAREGEPCSGWAMMMLARDAGIEARQLKPAIAIREAVRATNADGELVAVLLNPEKPNAMPETPAGVARSPLSGDSNPRGQR
jgi:hypothetical protein